MKRVEVVGLHLESMNADAFMLLRELEPPHRLLPITIGAVEALSIAIGMSGELPATPLAADVMVELVEQLGARLAAVEVTGCVDGRFTAELTLRGPGGEQRIDARPSDGIAVAVRVGAPMFVSDAVLDEAAAVLDVSTDAEGPLDASTIVEGPVDDDLTRLVGRDGRSPREIDTTVAAFRVFLDGLDAADFGDPNGETGPEHPSGH
jgi:bifunctional DNase/RNase